MRSIHWAAIGLLLASFVLLLGVAPATEAGPSPTPAPPSPGRPHVTPPPPSSIARRPLLTRPLRRTDTCQTITALRRQQALARGIKHTLCTRPVAPAHHPVRPAPRTAPAQFSGPDTGCVEGVTVFNRFYQCTQQTTGIIAIDNQSGATVGEVDVDFAFWTTLANNLRSWDEDVYLTVTNEWGIIAGNTSLGTPMQCNDATANDCFLTSTDYPLAFQQALMDPIGTNWSGTVSWISQDPGITFQTIGLTFFWSTTAPDVSPNTVAYELDSLERQRCDNTLANFKQGGCVNPDSLNYYILSLSDPSVQAVAQHIYNAEYGTSASPPLPDQFGVPGANNPLTRDTNATDIDANRQASCNNFVPNGPGDSCDEFPFASTYQGAAFVGPGRFSTEHVPSDQNSQAGSELIGFYLSQRIIDGDPFYALIVS